LVFVDDALGFRVTGLSNGAAAEIVLQFPSGFLQANYAYYKYDDHAKTWSPFPLVAATPTSPQTGAFIDPANNRVILYLVDGGRGDMDGMANGVIVDPGSLVITPVTATITGAPVNPSPVGTAITLNSTVTDSANPGGPFTYSWEVTKSQGGSTPIHFQGQSNSASSFTFTPDTVGSYVVTLFATDPDGVISNQARQTITVSQATPVVTWTTPADIVYGTALSASQLDATANVPGTLVYSPSAGTVLGAGQGQTLTVSFTPQDATNFSTANATVTINVLKATPTILWANPPDITFGTALSSAQLNATAINPITGTTVAGTFTYSPAVGTVLGTGNGQALSVSFVPADLTDYNTASKTVSINVLPATAAVGITGPSTGVRGQPLTFAFNVGGGDPTTQYTYTINWGDGSKSQTVTGSPTASATHAFAETNTYHVTVTATGKQGASIQPATQSVSISAYAIQIDLIDGKRDLVVGSGGHDSEIEIENAGHGALVVEIENRWTEQLELQVAVSGPIDRIMLYGQKSDELSVAPHVKIDAILHAGMGDSILQGGGGNNILVGGPGNDILIGGRGRDLLIGGGGSDLEIAGAGDDILIGGTTNYDANEAALLAILEEWTRTDVDYATRVNQLVGTMGGGLNGGYLLNTNSVHNDALLDVLAGGAGADLFFLSSDDVLAGKQRSDVVIKG
jgi:hypothetical protein